MVGHRFYFLALVGLVGWLCFQPCSVPARETDNFYLPLDIDLADVGDFLEAVHTCVLEEVVKELNSRIERVLRLADPRERASRLDRLHDTATLADALIARFGYFLVEDTRLERALRGSWARKTYPARKTSHGDIWMNLSAHLPLDPRQFAVLQQSHTVRACGVYFGTDKMVHFHHLGISYYMMYRRLLERGLSTGEALRSVIEHNTRHGFFAETGLFGSLITGIYSNGDLAANLAGFKFYLNLTEEVILKGKPCAPLIVRNSTFWRLNQHVRPGSGWFCAFISDHWNEALNPSLYEASMRPGIRRVLTSRAAHIVQFYTEKDGRPNDPTYFDNLARELSTYYGEPYGHSGQFDKLMTIGNTCIRALQEKAANDRN